LWRKADHPASWTDLASLPLASPLTFKRSTTITPYIATSQLATLWWK
jgi:hypothetical protein